MSTDKNDAIRIRGARQNNLKNLDLDLPLNELIVVTGVSGSGKSSLVFDTLYAEGQRRYVETFSPYARQFLDRMDKPAVDRIEGIPPAIAIDQTNPVRTSRSTVGTMTELNDHIKLLYARAGHLHCRACGKPVRRDTPESICDVLLARAAAAGDPRLIVTFPISVPKNFSEAEVEQLLGAQGYTRIHAREGNVLHVVQDRFRAAGAERARVVEAIEAALRVGAGRVNVVVVVDAGEDAALERQATWRYSTDLHCADDDLHYSDPSPSLFSFNSPIGACETCCGFGRVIGIDFGLVIPDTAKSLAGGAIKPWQTESYNESQRDLALHAGKRGVAMDIPWRDLPEEHRNWVLEGDPDFRSWEKSWPGKWYGVRRFFAWLETKAYKMHIRVLLSRYRAYTPCTACGGARLKPDALLWRVGTLADANTALGPFTRYRPPGARFDDATLQRLAGLSIHDLMLLPVERVRTFFDDLHLPAPLDEATDLLLAEIRARVRYLCEVGLGYLTLDRQSRTLSGGEVQRINLTTALGTSLVNTLFVLDEPSIGLHPRDMGQVIAVMHRLRDAGNSIVVVEHDPQIMCEADRILDIGPGPGERGGNVVFNGTPIELRASHTLTAEYLSGRKRADAGVKSRAPKPSTPRLVLEGATEHNLKGVDVDIPLGHLVCVTGVSGSGKSTLIQDVLYPALLKKKGKPTEAPGAHARLLGDDWLAEVVMVDQTPIGKSSRSNPASYVGAFDAIRKLFADAPQAKERGYTAGTFSFNAGNGRCPTCSGSGFEHVEMQFLSDVYLRCPDCDGTRYRAEVREVKLDGRSIADALDMTVSEAVAFFAAHPEVRRALQPLADVGLEYLRLGQPVPTLSGGEAQRLKLAGHLVDSGTPPKGLLKRGKLFLFDEPTTGLHFDDTARLLRAFRQLIDAGHSLIVIEHNLDVIRAADWIIDLGPEGGEAGGELLCAGTPDTVMACAASHTGKALHEYQASFIEHRPLLLAAEPRATYRAVAHADNSIRIHNAREHNLKNIDISLPRDRFTVITGVSGSGKSTLAFDIVFGEGQRRYLESLNAYARQFVQPASKPDVDAIWGIPPTVAIEQRTSRGGRKSTVATLTEIYHFLRLLYVKLGVQHCPNDGTPIAPQSPDAITARILRDWRGSRIGLLAPLVVGRKGLYTDLAKWARGKGYSHLRVDGEFLPTQKWPRLDRFKEHSIDLPVADLVIAPENEADLRSALAQALQYGKGVARLIGPLDKLAAAYAAAQPASSPAAVRAQRSAGTAGAKSKGGDPNTDSPSTSLRYAQDERGFGGVELTETAFSTKRACPTCGESYPELGPLNGPAAAYTAAQPASSPAAVRPERSDGTAGAKSKGSDQNADSPSTSLRYAQDERGFVAVELTKTAFSTERTCPTCGQSHPELDPLDALAAAYTAAQPAFSAAAVRPERSDGTADAKSKGSDPNADSPSTPLRYAQDERGIGGVELTKTAFSAKPACPTCGQSYPELGPLDPLDPLAAACDGAQPASSPAAVRAERSAGTADAKSKGSDPNADLSLIHI